jgi:hypothetical protein
MWTSVLTLAVALPIVWVMQHGMRIGVAAIIVLTACLWPGAVLAAERAAQPANADADADASKSVPYRPAFEVNLVQPFLGITDAKVLVPVARTTSHVFRGELMLGAYTDYAWGPISRPVNDYGKVWLLGVRPGYREYLAYGFFVDASMVVGLRHEEHNTRDDSTLNGFYGRLWANAGWQVDVTERAFLNVRGGAGVIVFRTDKYGSTEKTWQPAADIDVGLRF